MGSLRFTEIQTRPTEVLDLTSLTLDEFQRLVPPFEAAFEAHIRQTGALDGRPRTARRYTTYTNCPLPSPEDRLLFILVYLKTYPLQVVQGRLFGMGQSKAHQWIHVLFVVLRATLRTLGDAAHPVRAGIGEAPRGGRGRRGGHGRADGGADHIRSTRGGAGTGGSPPPFWRRWHRTAHRAPPGST